LALRFSLIVDMAAPNGSATVLAAQPDVTAVAKRPPATAGSRSVWIGSTGLAVAQRHGRWCLTVDADELTGL